MLSKKEQACFKCVIQYRELKLLSQLRKLTAANIIRKSPLRYVFDVDKPIVTSVKTKNEKLLFPFVIALKLFIIISFPLYFSLAFVSELFYKIRLKTQIKKVRSQFSYSQSFKKKDLESLWRINSLERNECSEEEQMSILKAWVQTLYGEATFNEVGLDNRLNEVKSSHVRFIVGCAKIGARVRLSKPVDALVRRLSTELPAYE